MPKAGKFIPEHDPQFFAEQNGADSRGAPADRFRLRSDDGSSLGAPANANDDVWGNYDPASSAMFDEPKMDSKHVHSSSRWLVRGAVAAFFVAGIGIAAATYTNRAPQRPAAEGGQAAAPAPIDPAAPAMDAAAADRATGGGATESTGALARSPDAAMKPLTPAPEAQAVANSAPKATASKAAAKPVAPDPRDAAAASTYSRDTAPAANATAPATAAPSDATPANPSQSTDALPPIMPQPSGDQPAAETFDPGAVSPTAPQTLAPVPGGAQAAPEIAPGNEPTPQ